MEKLNLGSYIKAQRTMRRMTQKQLSIISGVSVAKISRIENGGRNSQIDIDVLSNIAKDLHIPIEKILRETGYIEEDIIKKDIYVAVEKFLNTTEIQNHFTLPIETMEIIQRQEIYHYIIQTLQFISVKF